MSEGEAIDVAALVAAGEPVPAPPDPEPDEGRARNEALAKLPMTDLGNAERFVARHGGDFKWTAARGWLAWDGRRWARDGAEGAVALAEHATVRAIQDEARALAASGDDMQVDVRKDRPVFWSDKVAGWGRASESAARMKVIGERAKAFPAVDIDHAGGDAPRRLDADPMLLNVFNGTLSIDGTREGDYVVLRPHDRADLITKLAPVTHDRGATCPHFEAFLAEVQPAAETRRFLAQWMGLSLTALPVQRLVFHYGKGRNGKSTFVDACGGVIGDYGRTMPIETFLTEGRGRSAGAATPDLALLPGVRFLHASEPEKGARMAEAQIKALTGGEPILARQLHRDYLEFTPVFKLSISGNYRPEIAGSDEGIWRRMILVPWTITVPPEKVDAGLPAKLRAEASGILNWMLDGLCDYIDNGLVLPPEVSEATAAYRIDSDPLGRFLAQCTELVAGERTQSSELHRLHTAWTKASGEREWSAIGLTKALRERGYRTKHSGVVWWLDVKMTRSPHEFAGAAGSAAAAGTPPPPADAGEYGDV